MLRKMSSARPKTCIGSRKRRTYCLFSAHKKSTARGPYVKKTACAKIAHESHRLRYARICFGNPPQTTGMLTYRAGKTAPTTPSSFFTIPHPKKEVNRPITFFGFFCFSRSGIPPAPHFCFSRSGIPYPRCIFIIKGSAPAPHFCFSVRHSLRLRFSISSPKP